MNQFKSNHLFLKEIENSLLQLKKKKIVVIGDLMLDHYLWGQVERISPEAPVPIVDIKKQEFRLGGASNVVNNLISLGANPFVIGLIGKDTNADYLVHILQQHQVKTSYLVVDDSRPTTVKSRIFASSQQVIRYDIEEKKDISLEIEKKILEQLLIIIPQADAVLLEDYNKGLLTEKIILKAIELANQFKIPITVDPKYKNFFTYQNCTVFKPNFVELQKNMGIDINNDQELLTAAKELYQRVKPLYLIITLGDRGLIVLDNHQEITRIPTFAQEVFDVSGAGDTVISALTLCLAAKLDIRTSAIIANHAAGAVCGKRGIHAVTPEDIIASVKLDRSYMEVHE